MKLSGMTEKGKMVSMNIQSNIRLSNLNCCHEKDYPKTVSSSQTNTHAIATVFYFLAQIGSNSDLSD